jgi:glycine cleavage system H protein
LLYDVDNHVWFEELPDGNVKLGMTTVAAAMAGPLLTFTPKKVGRAIEAGKTCATVESGKWVGSARSAAAGQIVAVNQAVIEKPSLANEDPYGAGWLVMLKPADWAAVKPTLVTGAEIAPRYAAKMEADGFPGCVCAVEPKS